MKYCWRQQVRRLQCWVGTVVRGSGVSVHGLQWGSRESDLNGQNNSEHLDTVRKASGPRSLTRTLDTRGTSFGHKGHFRFCRNDFKYLHMYITSYIHDVERSRLFLRNSDGEHVWLCGGEKNGKRIVRVVEAGTSRWIWQDCVPVYRGELDVAVL